MTRPAGRTAIRFVAGLVLVFVMFTAGRYAREIREERDRVANGGRIASTPCGPIEYAETGVGPPVLVVHGAGGGFDQGMDFGAPLAEEGFRVVAMSRFGYLRTPLPADASAAAQADAHACLLDALKIPRAAIIGASAGAPSALQFAIRHPDRCRGLILVVPATYVPRPGGGASVETSPATRFLFDTALRSDFLFWATTRFARPLVIQAILATPPAVVAAASADEKARVDEMLAHILPVSERRAGLRNDAALTSSLPRYPLEQIAVPTLVLGVADDLFGTYEAARYTAAHIPRARFVGFPTGGHVWVGHQKEGVAEIAAFLKR